MEGQARMERENLANPHREEKRKRGHWRTNALEGAEQQVGHRSKLNICSFKSSLPSLLRLGACCCQ